MTKYTPNLNLPYPEASDAPRGWEQIQALAESVDSAGGIWGFSSSVTALKLNSTTGFEPYNTAFKAGNGITAGTAGLVVPVAGIYQVSASVRWTTTAVSNLSLSVGGTNDGTVYGAQYGFQGMSNLHSITVAVSLEAADQVWINVDQLTATTCTVSAGNLSARWLGPAAA